MCYVFNSNRHSGLNANENMTTKPEQRNTQHNSFNVGSRALTKAVLLMLLVFCCSSMADAGDKVVWNKFRLPGYFSDEGMQPGVADLFLQHIIDALPEYEHSVKTVPIIRTLTYMEMGGDDSLLLPGKTKLPQEMLEKVYSSTVQVVVPPPGIVVRKDDLDITFGGGKNVSLRGLLFGEIPIRFCWRRGSTYHPNILKAVEDYTVRRDKPNLHVLTNFKNVYSLLDSGRIDAFISHVSPFQAEYPLLKKELGLQDMVFIPLTESAEDPTICYTFASKNKVGEELITKIDAIHRSESYHELMREVIRSHFLPEHVDEYIDINMRLIGTPLQ